MRHTTLDQYMDELDRIGKDIKSGKLIVDDIPLYTNRKINIKELQSVYSEICYFISITENNTPGLRCKLSKYLSYSKSTFLAPAYFLNNYLDDLTQYTIKYQTNKLEKNETEYFISTFTINIHNIFISAKSLLDRLSTIMTYYYNGLSLNLTFGRIENGKSKGLMGRVIQDKDNDSIFKYIYEQYYDWIKSSISLRDTVIHYNDMGLEYHPTMDNRIIYFHNSTNLFDDNNTNVEPYSGHYYKSISRIVDKLYEFYLNVLTLLLNKDIVYSSHHFCNKYSYEQYKMNLKASTEIKCRFCGNTPDNIHEYIQKSKNFNTSPSDFVKKYNNTYNEKTFKFSCTECYLKLRILN